MQIYLSYAKQDTYDLALNTADVLAKLPDVAVMVDRSVRVGPHKEMAEFVQACDVLVALWSPGAEQAGLSAAVEAASAQEKRVVVVQVGDAVPPAPPDITLAEDAKTYLLARRLVDALGLPEIPPPEPPITTSPPMMAGTPMPADLEAARAFGERSNADWQPIIRTFYVRNLAFEMCLVPAGRFVMGDETTPNAQPPHEQVIERPYWISRYPMWRSVWLRANEEHGKLPQPFPENWQQTRHLVTHPVMHAYYETVLRLVDWLGAPWRLPTEPEWEYAARGPDGLAYPWGNTFDAEQVVYAENSGGVPAPPGSPYDFGTPSWVRAARMSGPSWVGAAHMSGSLDEWTASAFAPYPYDSKDGREAATDSGTRVLRGGGFGSSAEEVRATARQGDPNNRFMFAGYHTFRLCRTADEGEV